MLSPDQIKKLEKLAKVGDIAIADELNALETKIEALEEIVPKLREAKDGETGPMGPRGEKGDSIVGPMGPAGRDGIDGKDGKDGIDGKDGRDGIDGKDGKDGIDGKDGFVDEATVAYLEDEVKKAKLDREAYDRALGIVDQRTSFLINKVNNLPTNSGITSVVAGTNVSVDNTDPKNPVVSATVEGGATAWGDITGTLSAQTDLNSALAGKSDTSHNHTGVYEPADATILKSAAIGVTVAAQSHDHTGVYAPALGADDNYVTDAEKAALHSHSNKTALDAVTGVNTGDQDLSGYSLTSHNHTGVYAPASHTHTVSDISATGTPSATTYLRGDGSWSTPEGSTGGLTAPQVASLISIRF